MIFIFILSFSFIILSNKRTIRVSRARPSDVSRNPTSCPTYLVVAK